MSARRIARELAIILMPQLPKDRQKLEALEYETLIAKSVHILVDHAKQCLSEAEGLLTRGLQQLNDSEMNHPQNASLIKDLHSVPLKSGELKEQLKNLERCMEFISEALDIPEMSFHSGRDQVDVLCRNCDHMTQAYVERNNSSEVRQFIISLVSTHLEHRHEVDDFIKRAKSKWQVERMVSIDRDILRLACTEAFFMPDVPINVAISEAVELCQRFADQKAARFINGILADLAEEAKYFRRMGKFREPGEVESVESGSASGTP
jgi:N utilization substance protein B